MGKTKSHAHGIADIDTHSFEDRIKKITTHLDAIDELMSDAVELDDKSRASALRLQGDDEADALDGVLDFAAARPELFKDLAAEDDGNDPETFEVELLKTRLANAKALTALLTRFDDTKQPIADSALYIGTLAKRPALAAYEIAKPYQARDTKNGKLLNDAVNYYRGRAIAGAKTRAAKKKTTTP